MVNIGPMPFHCGSPLEEPEEFTTLRACPGPLLLRTAAGGEGWLVTRYDDVRKLAADPRIGRAHPCPQQAPRLWDAAMFAPQTNFDTEFGDHRCWRRVLTPRFTRPGLRVQWESAVPLLDGLIDTVLAAGPPVDLRQMIAEPFATRLILDFIGIPGEEYARMRAWSDAIRVPDDRAVAEAARSAILGRLGELIDHRHADPADDVLTDLARALTPHGPLTREQAVEAAGHLFFGGHETVAARIAYGLLFLLAHPDQYQALHDDPSLAAGAAEEILRLAVPGGSWIPRYAREDIPFRGSLIRAGDLVVFALQAANRDPDRFTGPDLFDITRAPNPHVAFGHGKFYCLGADLARIALRTVCEQLPQRLPGLGLHAPWAVLSTDKERVTGGLGTLLVSW
ncbi:cytochrome P450 [Streptomyces roseoverticillatus]|uniref:Cytochrome P450 n=1 Tax=Streptomyces roseoverticillatus TaxID=66429 RepID=A0ABV3J310_9ACTN